MDGTNSLLQIAGKIDYILVQDRPLENLKAERQKKIVLKMNVSSVSCGTVLSSQHVYNWSLGKDERHEAGKKIED